MRDHTVVNDEAKDNVSSLENYLLSKSSGRVISSSATESMAFLAYNDQNNKTWNNAQLNLQIIPPFSVLMRCWASKLVRWQDYDSQGRYWHLIHDIGLV